MYTSAYGRLSHDPIRHETVGSGSLCFCYLVFQVLDRFKEPSWYGMHLVAFGDVAKSLAKYQEDDFMIVSGPIVPYRSLQDDETSTFEVAILVDSIRKRDGEPGVALSDGLQPNSGPEDESHDIDRSMDATPFDDDFPN